MVSICIPMGESLVISELLAPVNLYLSTKHLPVIVSLNKAMISDVVKASFTPWLFSTNIFTSAVSTSSIVYNEQSL